MSFWVFFVVVLYEKNEGTKQKENDVSDKPPSLDTFLNTEMHLDMLLSRQICEYFFV